MSDSDHHLQVFFGLGLVLGGPVIQQFVPVRLQIIHLTELGEVGHETLAIPLVVGVDYLELVVALAVQVSRGRVIATSASSSSRTGSMARRRPGPPATPAGLPVIVGTTPRFSASSGSRVDCLKCLYLISSVERTSSKTCPIMPIQVFLSRPIIPLILSAGLTAITHFLAVSEVSVLGTKTFVFAVMGVCVQSDFVQIWTMTIPIQSQSGEVF